MLHGGGRMTLEAFDCFLNLAGGPEAKIVLIPSAGYRAADYENLDRFTSAINRNFRMWTRLPSLGKASSVELLHTDDPRRDANDELFHSTADHGHRCLVQWRRPIAIELSLRGKSPVSNTVSGSAAWRLGAAARVWSAAHRPAWRPCQRL